MVYRGLRELTHVFRQISPFTTVPGEDYHYRIRVLFGVIDHLTGILRSLWFWQGPILLPQTNSWARLAVATVEVVQLHVRLKARVLQALVEGYWCHIPSSTRTSSPVNRVRRSPAKDVDLARLHRQIVAAVLQQDRPFTGDVLTDLVRGLTVGRLTLAI